MNDRIKLAEAMFPEWTISSNIHGDLIMWHGKDREGKSIRPVPDPENDANDDYAVLEWMRQKCKLLTVENANLTDWKMWDKFCSELNDPEDREIGDYARAALKEIE